MRGDGYFVGIGSNIAPEKNVPKVIERLLVHFPIIVISEVIHTQPVGIDSDRDFLNAVFFLPTILPREEVKRLFNRIEEELGRDRSDPDKKIKDRPADIDILLRVEGGQSLREKDVPDESYFRALFLRLASLMGFSAPPPSELQGEPVALALNAELFGQAPATIYRDGDPCHVVLFEDAADR